MAVHSALSRENLFLLGADLFVIPSHGFAEYVELQLVIVGFITVPIGKNFMDKVLGKAKGHRGPTQELQVGLVQSVNVILAGIPPIHDQFDLGVP